MEIKHHKTGEWVQLESSGNIQIGSKVKIQKEIRDSINFNTENTYKKLKYIQFKYDDGSRGCKSLSDTLLLKACKEDSILKVLEIARYNSQRSKELKELSIKLGTNKNNFVVPISFVTSNINTVTEIKSVEQFKETFGTLETAEAYNKQNILIKDVEQTFTQCLDTLKKKNNDYAGEVPTDVYKNLRACAQFGVPPKMGVMVRLSDKFARIGNLMSQEAAVKDEAIEDTINDAINYLAILKSILKNKIE